MESCSLSFITRSSAFDLQTDLSMNSNSEWVTTLDLLMFYPHIKSNIKNMHPAHVTTCVLSICNDDDLQIKAAKFGYIKYTPDRAVNYWQKDLEMWWREDQWNDLWTHRPDRCHRCWDEMNGKLVRVGATALDSLLEVCAGQFF